jgi:hypothetical protein
VVVKLLLEKDAELESRDTYFGQTPLPWAAENGHRAAVKVKTTLVTITRQGDVLIIPFAKT